MRWRPCKSGRNDTFIAAGEQLLKAVGARRLRADDNSNPSAIWKFLDLMAERSTCASIVRLVDWPYARPAPPLRCYGRRILVTVEVSLWLGSRKRVLPSLGCTIPMDR